MAEHDPLGGELADEALRGLRNSIADLGGGRRSFRPPDGHAGRAEPRPYIRPEIPAVD